jgi:cell division protein FtsA
MGEEIDSIVALDLGSHQVKVVVGRFMPGGGIEIIGAASVPCAGVKQGAIINIETTVKSIREAITHAELMAGIEISEVIVNISGKTIQSGNHKSVVAITNRERIVQNEDVTRAIDAIISTTPIPSDKEIVHVLSKEFSVDDQASIKDPLGMTGVRLEAEVHIVMAGLTSIHNLKKCIETAGLSKRDNVLSSFASAEAVLTSEEREIGTALVDIGSGITDIVIYIEGGVTYTSVVPFGGGNITNDISIGLKTSVDVAEKIKCQNAHCLINMVDPTAKIEVPATGGKPSRLVLKQDLTRIVEPRVREILELVNYELEKSGKKAMLAGGVILTGGTSLLGGIDILAEEVIGLSVSRAKPAGLQGIAEKVASPQFSTAVGLIKHLGKEAESQEEDPIRGGSVGTAGSGGKLTSKLGKIFNWMQTNL